ncbi:hypothetical protein QN277_022769 [Acacia crassicarpa]|nr:hypothetical protein QN277_022769 [Acacia crassicarpa]
MEEILLSSWFKLHPSVPSSHIQPPESRPGELLVAASSKTIPVIDLGRCDDPPPHDTLSLIMKASQEYGFFQVINHGVSEELMEDTLNILKEFYDMPPKEKIAESSKSPNGICKLYTSAEVYRKDAPQYWKDTLRHPCLPSGEYMEFWPQKPERYREIVGKYTEEVRKLGMKILKLVGEGLGLTADYFCGELSGSPVILAHHYPPCPQPNLTLGIPKHKDPSLVTILLQPQGIHALQILKDGQWLAVDPSPNALVVNVGLLLQIISNKRLIGAEHRVVTNANTARTSVAYFINPKDKCVIQPEISLITSTTPPLYKPISFSDFRTNFLIKGSSIEADLLYHP